MGVEKGSAEKKLKVLICDDDPIMLERLRNEENSLLEIRQRGSLVRILPSELCYMERSGHTTYLRLLGGDSVSSSEKLDALLDRVDQRLFCRCHVSFIVCLGNVQTWNKDCFKMKDGTEIPISRAYERSARDSFMRYVGA